MDISNMNLEKFKATGLSILIIKNEKILFQSKEEMLKPLVKAIRETDMNDATVYDKIVGRAAALLFIYAKVREVFAVTVSKPALSLLKENQVPISQLIITENIMNHAGSDTCPMDKLSAGKTPEEFYKILLEKIKN